MMPADQQGELRSVLRGNLSAFTHKVFHEVNPCEP